ncbi:MAG: matrixin family metalloprotease [Mycoplasmatales bacterium]
MKTLFLKSSLSLIAALMLLSVNTIKLNAFSSCANTNEWHLIGTNNNTKADGKLNYSYSGKYKKQISAAKTKYNNDQPGDVVIDSTGKGKGVVDMYIVDQYDKSASWVAVTSSEGKMFLNNHYMSKYSNTQNTNVAIHEMGHAFGMAHRSTKTSVMQRTVTTITNFDSTDKNTLSCLNKKIW